MNEVTVAHNGVHTKATCQNCDFRTDLLWDAEDFYWKVRRHVEDTGHHVIVETTISTSYKVDKIRGSEKT